MQTGWYREVQAKSPDSHATRALLNSRALLVRIQRDLENQVRGLLKISGLIVGRAKDGVFAQRTQALLASDPVLAEVALPLLAGRESIHKQLMTIECRVRRLAQANRQARAFMTVQASVPSQHSLS